MFDNIGWAEIFTIIIVGLIIIGPEKLPGVIKDVRAAVFAARRAITNARAELDGNLGEEFREFREPINKVAEWQRMGPKAAITKALFDGDEEFLDDFDPKKIMASGTAGAAHRARQKREGADVPMENPPVERRPEATEPRVAPRPPSQDSTAQTIAEHTDQPAPGPRGSGGGGFFWEDVT